MNICIRENLIRKVIFFSLLIIISTELLSYFSNINSANIKIFWISVITILIISFFLFKKKFIFLENLIDVKKYFNFELFIISVILILTLINSIIYPPNTLDALSYHMPKIMHWIQNENINFYPTNDLRQLILAPFSEFVILHLYLFFGSDIFTNFVQWFSMFICLITVSLISKELGCNLKFQIFSSLFCITLPMGILQSTSAQTDYITAMWLCVMVYFLIRYVNTRNSVNILFFGFALSIGIFTKGTTYIFALPFCIWLGLYVFLKNKKDTRFLFIVPLLVLIINFGHFNRNIIFTGNPLGITDGVPSFLNKSFNYQSFISNFVRNFGLNLSLPNAQINSFTAKKITLFLNDLGISTKDPKSTKIPHRGYYIPFSFYESSAPNTLHFLVIVLSIIFCLLKKLNSTEKNYLYSIIFGYLFFSFLLIWTAQHNRLLLGFFILSSPLVSVFLFKLRLLKITKLLSVMFIIYSIPYIFFNKARPLIGEITIQKGIPKINSPNYLFNKEKNQLYFIADKFYNKRNKDLYLFYLEILENIKKTECKIIGFDEGGILLEYPLWRILKDYDEDIKIYNINVKNKSSRIKPGKDTCLNVYKFGVKF